MKTFPHRYRIFFLVGIALLCFLLPVVASATEAPVADADIPLVQVEEKNLADDDSSLEAEEDAVKYEFFSKRTIMAILEAGILAAGAAGVLVYTIMNHHKDHHKDDHKDDPYDHYIFLDGQLIHRKAGLYNSDNLHIDSFSDSLNVTNNKNSKRTKAASAYGMYAGKDLTIGTFSGEMNVKAIGGSSYEENYSIILYAYGLYAQKGMYIGDFSGKLNVEVSNLAKDHNTYGMYAGEDLTIGTFSGEMNVKAIVGSSYEENYFLRLYAYGLYAGNDMHIGNFSGKLNVEEGSGGWFFSSVKAYGLYAGGELNGGAPDIPLLFSGELIVKGSRGAIAISSLGAMNLYITGTVGAKNISGDEAGRFGYYYAIEGGDGNDILSLGGGAILIGDVDLGGGENTLNLYGSNSTSNSIYNITNLNVGNGIDAAYWKLQKDGSIYISLNGSARINENSILEVNSKLSGNINIDKSAILLGNGEVVGDVVNSGILMPFRRDNATGDSFSIVGNYTHNPNAIFMVRINEDGRCDKFLVFSDGSTLTGTATLNGGTVSILGDQGLYEQDKKYVILTADAIDGKFDKVETNLAFLDASLEYGNYWWADDEVILTVTRNGKPYTSVAETETQKQIATMFDKAEKDKDKNPLIKNVLNNINSLSANGARNAYEQCSGRSHGIAVPVSWFVANKHIDVLKSRMNSFVYGSTPSSRVMEMDNSNGSLDTALSVGSAIVGLFDGKFSDQEKSPRRGFYGRTVGFNSTGDVAQSSNTSNTSGLLVGYDGKLSDRVAVGYAAGYYSTIGNPKGLNETLGLKSYQLSAYSTYNTGNFYLNGIMGYGHNTYDTKRQVHFSSLSCNIDASYAGRSLVGDTEAGYVVSGKYADIIPSLTLHGDHLKRDGFSESSNNNALGLALDTQSYGSLRFRAGIKVRKDLFFNGLTISPEASFTWNQQLLGGDNGFTARFAEYDNSEITGPSNISGKSMAILGGGLVMKGANNNLSLVLHYNKSLNEDLNTGAMKLEYYW